MPLRKYRCEVCGYERETFKTRPKCNHNQDEEGSPLPPADMVEVIVAPSAKFMEPRDPVAKERGKSIVKDQMKILKERTRNHSRENEIDELIAKNSPEMAKMAGWLNGRGRRKNKIDDL